MHTLFRTTLALFLAISIVMPSVYVGLETPRTQAYDFSGAGGGAIVASAVCNLGGWVNNFLSSAMPWLFPPVTATNINADKFHNITTAGAVIPPAESPTPLIVLDEALWGLEASFTTHVPTADTWMQLQNYEHSQQQAMIQRNTQAISESGNNVSINTGSITWKDCVLDPLVNLLKEMIIDAVTQSIIDWIKGGFKDTPQFLEDPEEFFRDLGMSVVSQYLFDRGLNDLLCEPFRIEIIFSVAFNYSQSNHREGGRLSCSLEDIFPGVNASIDINGDGTINENEQYLDSSTAYKEIVENGNIDFPGGGFPALTGMINNNSNNAIGAEFEVQSEAARQVATKQAKLGATLNLGKGWFPQYCKGGKDGGEGDGKERICTPGEAVAEQVNNALGKKLDALGVADEFAEIVNALISVLVETLLSEGHNLLNS